MPSLNLAAIMMNFSNLSSRRLTLFSWNLIALENSSTFLPLKIPSLLVMKIIFSPKIKIYGPKQKFLRLRKVKVFLILSSNLMKAINKVIETKLSRARRLINLSLSRMRNLFQLKRISRYLSTWMSKFFFGNS